MPLNIAFHFLIVVKYIFQAMQDVASKEIIYINIKQVIKQLPILFSHYILSHLS